MPRKEKKPFSFAHYAALDLSDEEPDEPGAARSSSSSGGSSSSGSSSSSSNSGSSSSSSGSTPRPTDTLENLLAAKKPRPGRVNLGGRGGGRCPEELMTAKEKEAMLKLRAGKKSRKEERRSGKEQKVKGMRTLEQLHNTGTAVSYRDEVHKGILGATKGNDSFALGVVGSLKISHRSKYNTVFRPSPSSSTSPRHRCDFNNMTT